MTEKVCIDCGRILCLEHFYAKPDAKDGRSPYCKECQKRRSTVARRRRSEQRWYPHLRGVLCHGCGTRPREPYSYYCETCARKIARFAVTSADE